MRRYLLAVATLVLTLPTASAAHGPTHRAIEEISARIEAGGASAHDFLRRAELYRIERDWDAAERDYDRASRLDPQLSEVVVGRAALHLDQGQPAGAKATIDGLLSVHPDHSEALRIRAQAWIALGQPLEAARDLDRRIATASRLTPDHYIERARLLAGCGDPFLSRAVRGLDEGIARLGPIVSLEFCAIELETRRGEFDSALIRLEAVAPQFDRKEILLERRGEILAAAGRVAEAREAYEAALAAIESGPSERRASSIDLAMDLELGYFTTAQVVRGPYLQIGTPNGVTVRWRTDLSTDSRVRFGPAPDDLSSNTDDAALVTDHEVTLTGLQPATRYFYSVGTTSVPLVGGDASYTFQTHPVPGPPHPTRFWIVGDGGTANADARAVRDAYAAYSAIRPADLWLMLGDNAYPSGTDAEYQAAVFDTYPEQLRRTVLWPTRGNHEVLVAPPGQDYYDIFSLPTAAQAGGLASGSEAYYSFDYANLHFICLDSEGTDRSPGGAMLTWLANDLASTTRQWIVAFWHHPTYSKGSHDSDDDFDSGGRMRDMRTNALPILEAGGVDLVLSGHSHSYERSFLLDGHYGLSTTLTQAMKIDPGDGRVGGDGPYMKPVTIPSPHEGAVHTVAGTSGQASGGSLNHPVMVTSLNILGSMVVDVDGARLDARFLSSTGAVLDSFTILKAIVTGAPEPSAPGVSLHLAPGRPSPFERTTSIAYTLPQAGPVRLVVFDVNGRRVRTLRNGDRSAGSYAEVWDGSDDQGQPLAAGVYFARLEAAGTTLVQRLALVR